MITAREESTGAADTTRLFASIGRELRASGYSIQTGALPAGLASDLHGQVAGMPPQEFRPAGIGRRRDRTIDRLVRADNIRWITGTSGGERRWLDWAGQLQAFLNRELFLGLFSFESHFAHYPPGAFYHRHIDAFRGESSRILSVVTYLNPGWLPGDGGELVIYPGGGDDRAVRVAPALGTLAVFLSEEIEHEVLPGLRDRFSVAGWFRVNSCHRGRADAPV
jgi:SM-20-related protein